MSDTDQQDEIATAEQAVKDYDARRESLTGRRVSDTCILMPIGVKDVWGGLQIKVVQGPYRDLGPIETPSPTESPPVLKPERETAICDALEGLEARGSDGEPG